MQTIGQLINIKKIKLSYPQKARKRNPDYEDAERLGNEVGVNKYFLMRQFKKFGKQNVLSLQSWMSDLPYDPKKGKLGLIVFELKRRFAKK